MGKQIRYTDADMDHNEDDAFSNFVDGLNFDDEDFLDRYEKPLRKRSKRSMEARRRIEHYWEDKELENRLDEYYYHTDD